MASEYLPNNTFEAVIRDFQNSKREVAKYKLISLDLEETHRRRQKKYEDNKKKKAFDECKQRLVEASSNFKTCQDELALAFYLLSENIANYTKFKGIDIDDAIQEGVLICFEKIDRFDSRKGKAFNYMTTCIWNHYRQLYRSAKTYDALKKKYHTHLQERFESIFIRNGKERSNSRGSVDRDSTGW